MAFSLNLLSIPLNLIVSRARGLRTLPRLVSSPCANQQTNCAEPVKYSPAYHMACAQQRVIHADAIGPQTKPVVRAALSRAFVELEMLKLRLRMKPAPKAIDVSPPPAKRLSAAGPRQFLDVVPVQHDPAPQQPKSAPTPQPVVNCGVPPAKIEE